MLQAAIAVHDQAEHYDDTDWPQILHYYELLETVSANPVVTLNHAVAVAMVHGPQAGLAMVADLEADGRLAGQHRLDAVRGHLLEMAGDAGAAAEAYLAAARLTTSIPERRYLETGPRASTTAAAIVERPAAVTAVDGQADAERNQRDSSS